MKLSDYYAPFGITKRRKKIAYCNINIVEPLIDMGIDYEMDTMKIKFCGITFPMAHIDDGIAEEFINTLRENPQSILDIWKIDH